MPTQLRALLVDNSAVTRRLIKKSLVEAQLADFTFQEAGDGLEALDLLRADGPDIVFVDVHMPRMDGIQFLRQMRREFQSSPPAVMITAESNRETLLEAFRQGSPDAFLLKPVNADRHYQWLRSLIQGIPVSSGLWKTPHADTLVTAVRDVLANSCKLGVGLDVDISLPTVICAQELRFLVQRGRTQSDAFCFLAPLGRLRAALSVGFSPGLIL